MRRLRRIFNRIMIALRLRKAFRPEDIPKKLSAEALAEAMKEARFLYFSHAVDVRSLLPGEAPELPRPADSTSPPP